MPTLKPRPHRGGKLLPKDEEFCQAIVAGSSGTQAYRDFIAGGIVTTNTAQCGAYKLLQMPQIRDRISDLREKDKRSVEEKLGFSREAAARFLVEAIQTPIGEIDASHLLAQEKTILSTSSQDGETSTVTKIKMVSKMDAMEKLAKMAGWYPSNGAGHNAGPLISINLGSMFSPVLATAQDAIEDGASACRTLTVQAIAIPAIGEE